MQSIRKQFELLLCVCALGVSSSSAADVATASPWVRMNEICIKYLERIVIKYMRESIKAPHPRKVDWKRVKMQRADLKHSPGT